MNTLIDTNESFEQQRRNYSPESLEALLKRVHIVQANVERVTDAVKKKDFTIVRAEDPEWQDFVAAHTRKLAGPALVETEAPPIPEVPLTAADVAHDPVAFLNDARQLVDAANQPEDPSQTFRTPASELVYKHPRQNELLTPEKISSSLRQMGYTQDDFTLGA